MTSNPAATLDHLFDRLIACYDGKTERAKRTDEDVWRPIKERLDRAGLSSQLRSTVIHGKVDELKFEHAWKNGVWHCYEPLSFDLADAEYIKDKARRWSGFLSTVRDAADQFKPIFIVGAPHDQQLMPAFENALQILRNSPVPPEVVAESDADQLHDFERCLPPALVLRGEQSVLQIKMVAGNQHGDRVVERRVQPRARWLLLYCPPAYASDWHPPSPPQTPQACAAGP